MKKILLFSSLFVLGALGTFFYLKTPTDPAVAANTADFRDGNIISDYVMSNNSAMSEAQVQTFLKSKNSCNDTDRAKYDSYTAQGYQYSWRDGHFVCLADENFSGESAAHIIWQAAQDYRINPQVLIVLLQKEQGLITDTWPNWNFQYRSAAGYGCPDTAACDSQYYGFKNQVRNAANFFRAHLDNNRNWNWGYDIGWNNILYSPNCTTRKSVYIENKATAALYIYTPYTPTQEVLNAGYGSVGGCSAYGNRNFWLYFTDWFGSTQAQGSSLLKVSETGAAWTGEGSFIGTTGQAKPLYTFLIQGDVKYSASVSDRGWLPEVSNGMMAGLLDQNKPIEAIRISLTGSAANSYDVYYRSHVGGIGWMGWAKNGEASGTNAQSKSIEAIQIMSVAKGANAPGDTNNASANINNKTYATSPNITVTAHVGKLGWEPAVDNQMISGTVGQNIKMEGVNLSITNTSLSGDIVYRAHVGNVGWQPAVKNGELGGTAGQARQLEAIQIALTGELANGHDVYYRTHISSRGWLPWTKNGLTAGSVGANLAIEALQVAILPKSAPLTVGNGVYNPANLVLPSLSPSATVVLSYSAHAANIGWMPLVTDGATAGTTGQSRAIEAIKLSGLNGLSGSVVCEAHMFGIGWSNFSTAEVCGTTGQSRPLEALKLKLTGDISAQYELHYRVHAAGIGWMDWVKDGELAGTTGQSRKLEAVEIKLVSR
jgi:uncharacterized protein YjdB